MSSNKGDQKQSVKQTKKTQNVKHDGKVRQIISNRTESEGNYRAHTTYWTTSAMVHIIPDKERAPSEAFWFEGLGQSSPRLSVSQDRDITNDYEQVPFEEVVLAMEFWNLAKSGKLKVGGQ